MSRELRHGALVPLIARGGLVSIGDDLVVEVQGKQAENSEERAKVVPTTSFLKLQTSSGLRLSKKLPQHKKLPPIT